MTAKTHLTPALSPRMAGGEGEFSAVIPLSSDTHLREASKTALNKELGLGGCTVGPDAILDGNAAVFVLAEGRVNQSVVIADVAVDDGEVFLLDGAGFEEFAEFAGGFGILGDEDNAAGFAVEAVD